MPTTNKYERKKPQIKTNQALQHWLNMFSNTKHFMFEVQLHLSYPDPV